MLHRNSILSLFILISILFFQTSLSLYSQINKSGIKTEIRGVWVHPGYFGNEKEKSIEKIKKTLDDYSESGINTLFILVKTTSGYVYFESKIAPKDPAYDWDFFGEILIEAKKRNMTVQPWFCVFTEGALTGKFREHPEWLIKSKKNEIVAVANPALPEVRAYERSLMIELINKYSVDWIHLDYIRFPCEPAECYFSFDAQTRKNFKEYSGEDPLFIKHMDSGDILWNEWINWNQEQITKFVCELKDTLKILKPSCKISAAVFPNPDNAKTLVGQDWENWVKDGFIDLLCPMQYNSSLKLFKKYTERARNITKGYCLLSPGIGIGNDWAKTPEDMLNQINICRSAGTDGFVFFSSYSLIEKFLKSLKDTK